MNFLFFIIFLPAGMPAQPQYALPTSQLGLESQYDVLIVKLAQLYHFFNKESSTNSPPAPSVDVFLQGSLLMRLQMKPIGSDSKLSGSISPMRCTSAALCAPVLGHLWVSEHVAEQHCLFQTLVLHGMLGLQLKKISNSKDNKGVPK